MIQRFFIMVLGTIVLSCQLAPIVYSGLLFIFPDFGYPFSRVYNRVAMLIALFFVLYYRREFSIAEVWRNLRLVGTTRATRHLLVGVSLSGITGLLLLPFLVSEGSLRWTGADLPEFAKIAKIIGAALLISVIEEGFFRGVLLNGLSRQIGAVVAVLVTSILYAVVHFITPVKSWAYPGFSLEVGFDYLHEVFGRFLLPGVAEGVVGLAIVGLVLCIARVRSGSLYLCIGLHAGWVIAIKFSQSLTALAQRPLEGAGARYFLVAQPLTWGYLALVGISVFALFRSSARSHGDS